MSKTLGWSSVVLILASGVFFSIQKWMIPGREVVLPERTINAASIAPSEVASSTLTPKSHSSTSSISEQSSSSIPLADNPSASATIAAQVKLAIPFTSQAPYGNWDLVAEESCEEASVLMASWFALGKVGSSEGGYANRINPDTANAQIQELVAWQKETLGHWEDTTTAETLRMLKEKLGVSNARLEMNITTETIKQELSSGNVVVVPAAGQLLHNPNFKRPGPPYHMLVIRGYNVNGFITNDPGTRKGEGYIYSESVLLNAIHDWTGNPLTIESGKKIAIVVGR